MATIPPQEHILLDLTCPHCKRMNLLAVVPAPGASSYVERAIECAHCKKVWEPSRPGPIMSGPFPK
jgi:phage FluMu protein Com